MPLPTIPKPPGLPTITGGFPTPTASVATGFGLTTEQQAMAGGNPALIGSPTRYATSSWDAAHSIAGSALSNATGGALQQDPRTWTPQEAAAQSDRAIARIAQVNPDIAKQLQEQRTGQEQPDSGGGFLHDVLGAVGAVMKNPVIHTAFDLLSRPAHIIPEILADEEHQSVWGNIAQALAGHSDKGMGQVLDKYGVLTGNDLGSRIAHNVLAFVGDVAVDPLTYLPGGALGEGIEALTRTGGKVAMKAALLADESGDGAKLLGRLAANMGGDSDAAFHTLWDSLLNGGDALGKTQTLKNLGDRLVKIGISEDAMPGFGHTMFEEGEAEAIRRSVEVADRTVRHIGQYGAGALGDTAKIRGLADQMGLPLEEVQKELKAIQEAGSGIGVSKALYGQGKQAAALLSGGRRFAFSLPGDVFKLRYIGNALPFTGALNFNMGRRFFAGLSGYSRLVKMVGSKEATLDHFLAFSEKGFSGLKEFSAIKGDDVAQRLTGHFLHGGSILYPLSEQVGKFTSHFTSNAALLRGGGLGALAATDARRAATHMKSSIQDAVFNLVKQDGTKMTPDEARASMIRLFNTRNMKSEDVDQLWNDIADYLYYLPTQDAAKAGAQKHWDDIIGAHELSVRDGTYAGSTPAGTQMAWLRDKQAAALDAEKRLKSHGSDIEEATYYYRQVHDNVHEQLVRAGIHDSNYDLPGAFASWMTPDDARNFESEGNDVARGLDWTFDDPSGLHGTAGTQTLDEELLTNTSAGGHTARGFNVSEVAPEEVDAAKRVLATAKGKPGDFKPRSEMTPAEIIAADTAAAEAGQADDLLAREGLNGGGGGMFSQESLSQAGVEVPASDTELKALAGGADKKDGVIVMPKGTTVDDITNAGRKAQTFKVRLRRPFVRDLREGGKLSTSEIDLPSEIERQMRDAIDVFKKDGKITIRGSDDETLKAVSPEARAIIMSEVNEDEKVAIAVTEEMKKQGYDGIVTIDKQGRKHATVFADDAGAHGIVGVAPHAPRVDNRLFGRGYNQVTQDVEEIVRGAANEEGRRGGSQTFIERLIRDVQGMSPRQAEATARKRMEEEGMTLGVNQRVFETDPFKIADTMTTHAAKRISDEMLGQTARRLYHLGLTRSVFSSKAVGVERYLYQIPDIDYEALGTLGDEVRIASERLAKLNEMVNPLKESMEAHAHAFTQYRDSMGDRIHSLEDLIRQNFRSDTRMAPEMGLSQLSKHQVDYQRWFEAGEKASKKFEVLSGERDNGILRGADKYGETYLYIKDGKVRAARQVANDAKNADGETIGGTVTAFTHPNYQRQGIGGQLLQAHWKKHGVYSATDPIGAAKRLIEKQAYSQDGVNLNLAGVRDLVERNPEHRLSLMADRAQRRFESATQELNDAANEFDRVKAGLTVKAAKVQPALVPVENARNMTGMRHLDIPGFTDMAMPQFMADEFNRAARGFKNIIGFHKEYRKFMSWWKSWATYFWPGFHVRNIQGGVFNNMLGGVSLGDYQFTRRIRAGVHEAVYGGLNSKKIKLAGKAIWSDTRDRKHLLEMGMDRVLNKEALENITYDEMGALLSDLGINAANGRAFAEAKMGTEKMAEDYDKQTWFEHMSVPVRLPNKEKLGEAAGKRFGGEAYVAAAKGAGSMTENMLRTAAWIRGMKHTGGDVWGARAFTMLRHGDYADLTDWEYGWVRDVMPFYKWMRTNVPFQIHQLLEAPGKLLAVSKARDAAWNAAGLDWNTEKFKEPEWMRDAIQLPVKLGPGDAFNVVMLDLPMNDMFTSGRDLISSFLPVVRPFLETYITKQETFTGRPIGAQAVPLSGFFGPIAPLLRATGLAKGGADGGTFISQGTANLLNAVPFFSRFRNWMYADPKRVQARGNTLASAMFGVQLRQVDQNAMASNELEFYYSNILPTTEYLKSLGYELPTTDDLKSAVGDTNTVLSSVGITPGTSQYQPDTTATY